MLSPYREAKQTVVFNQRDRQRRAERMCFVLLHLSKMERMVLRSICRAALRRYSGSASALSAAVCTNRSQLANRSLFTVSSPSASTPFRNSPSDGRSPLATNFGGVRYFSEDVSHMPVIQDSDIQKVFKDLMASSWDELPHTVVQGVKKAVSKNTDDEAGQEALKNVFRAAEASEEFSGILVSLKMEIDDSIGMSGENVKPLPKGVADALRLVFERYTTYLDAFGPEESYLKKKVETELGTKMIHLKMRCSGLGSEWGKVTVLGTSGLSGSYVEQRSS